MALAFALALLSSAIAPDATPADDDPAPTIRVGVRADARPFSYQGNTGANETVLANYRGYMIEICRRVLRDMAASGPFTGFRVEAVEVNPDSRFDDLDSGELDLLCGPDSVTSRRLRRHNVSHPMFLTGMTYGYVDPKSGLFPRARYCGNVVGVVRGTTAATRGLEMLESEGTLLRFDRALELYLAKSPKRLERMRRAERKIMDEQIKNNPDYAKLGRRELRDKLHPLIEPRIREIQDELKPEIKTEECPDGFKDGLPVRLYNDHDKGVAAFCDGKVLYYIGDYDIIERKTAEHGDCPVILKRFTQTREIYAAFFRTGFRNAGMDSGTPDEPTRDDSTSCERCTIDAPLLYAVFNHTLLRMMQSNIDILDFEFRREFGNTEKSEDLQRFFDSFKMASDI